jgi:hypothetical protein
MRTVRPIKALTLANRLGRPSGYPDMFVEQAAKAHHDLTRLRRLAYR